MTLKAELPEPPAAQPSLSDESMAAILYKRFDEFLSEDARNFIVRLWHLMQFFDDAHDNDKTNKAQWALLQCFGELDRDHFYIKFKSFLQPVILVQCVKWFGSNAIESSKESTENDYVKAYMLRAGFYDVIAAIAYIEGKCSSGEQSKFIYDTYGETFAEYLKEVRYA